MATVFDAPAWTTLLSALRCPACGGHGARFDADVARAVCVTCGLTHAITDGILQINVAELHPEVVQERASVPATEGVAELGGWREAGYAPATDPASPTGRAYLSLPYDDGSQHFKEPGYFYNVSRFAEEFDFLARHLPASGSLLDVGADGTWSTAQWSRRGLTCIALDITDHLALAHLFQTACPPYALVNVDMHEPVFRHDVFDVITAFNALHHSKRLDALAANLACNLKPEGVLAFVEPYVQSAAQEAIFGAAQSASGINENVHRVERWHQAFAAQGLSLEAYSLSDSFNAVYRKRRRPDAAVVRTGEAWDVLGDYYASELSVTPREVTVPRGQTATFDVRVESRGRAAWSSRGPFPVTLCYHVSRVGSAGRNEMIAFDNERISLPSFVGVARPHTFRVPVTRHDPGTFEIEFDLVQEARTWFKERGGRTAIARVTVR